MTNRPNRANSIGPAAKWSSGFMFLAFPFFDLATWVFLREATLCPALYRLGFEIGDIIP